MLETKKGSESNSCKEVLYGNKGGETILGYTNYDQEEKCFRCIISFVMKLRYAEWKSGGDEI